MADLQQRELMIGRFRGTAVGAVLVVVLGACQLAATPEASPTTADPAGTVRLAMAAVTSHDYAALQDLTCSLYKEQALEPFVGMQGLMSLRGYGIKERDVAAALAITYSDVQIKEITRTETDASENVSGTGTPVIDKTKMRAIVTKVVKGVNSKATRADIDAAMSRLDLTPSKFTTIISLAKKGSAWILCASGSLELH